MIPAIPPHGRRLGIVGVSLTRTRLPRGSGQALDSVRDQLEQLIVESRFLEGAPFSWVTVAIRYGTKVEETPHYGPVNKRYGDLPLAIELDVQALHGVPAEELHRTFKVAVLRALVHAGTKYSRPIASLISELEKVNKNPPGGAAT